MDLGLSTKAAVYAGILSSSISQLETFCGTANCTWPTFPSLAVCGNCSDALYTESCSPENTCTYIMDSGTSLSAPTGDSTGYSFTVAPTNLTTNDSAPDSQAYFSAFDILSVSKGPSRTTAQAYQCALWFCVNSYNVTVVNGLQNTSIEGTWSKTEFSSTNNAHNDEYHFIDIPPELNANSAARYSVPTDSIDVLKNFMASKMWGNSSNIDDTADFSSDWIQAMQNASSDLSAWMTRLTLGMTNDIRVSGAPNPNNKQNNQFQYVGSAYVQAPYVKVQWP
jgi:hypothetical protein